MLNKSFSCSESHRKRFYFHVRLAGNEQALAEITIVLLISHTRDALHAEGFSNLCRVDAGAIDADELEILCTRPIEARSEEFRGNLLTPINRMNADYMNMKTLVDIKSPAVISFVLDVGEKIVDVSAFWL